MKKHSTDTTKTTKTNIDWEKNKFYLGRIMAEFRHDIELEASGVKSDVNVFLSYEEQFMGFISSLLSQQKTDLIQKIEEWYDQQGYGTGTYNEGVEDVISLLKQLQGGKE